MLGRKTVILFLLIFSYVLGDREWKGVRNKIKISEVKEDIKAEDKIKETDTVFLDRKIIKLPIKIRAGIYLGDLGSVKCFNCSPGIVSVYVEDTSTTKKATLSLRMEVWKEIKRPIKDRRIFEYYNKCFYFGFNEIDTVFLAGEWIEVTRNTVDCYPYVQRQ